MQFFSIGVYGFSEKEFFDALINHHIDLFVDIRQRRGVRGKKYSFVNSTYLQQELSRRGIGYLYEKGLSPTTHIRDAQKKTDKENSVLKISRTELGELFILKYTSEIIDNFNFDAFIDNLKDQYSNIVLFCVEATPSACHRSLVINKLKQLEYTTRHIT